MGNVNNSKRRICLQELPFNSGGNKILHSYVAGKSYNWHETKKELFDEFTIPKKEFFGEPVGP